MTVKDILDTCIFIYRNITIYYAFNEIEEEYEELKICDTKYKVPVNMLYSKVDQWTIENGSLMLFIDYNINEDDLK